MNLNTMIPGINTIQKKTSKGRKKIEIKTIEKESTRQVTFSKRRTGLFKKASELCVLTGCQLAVLVHSPGGRIFAFGHPSADVIVDRYVNGTVTNNACKSDESSSSSLSSSSSSSSNQKVMNEFNQHYVKVSKQLEIEKREREMIEESKDAKNRGVGWYDESIEEMKVDELELYLYSLVELKRKVLLRADDLMISRKTPNLLMGCSNLFDHVGGNDDDGMGPPPAGVFGT
ncbi:agamous-like MADS-box protein AGL62 [Rutidosis leptorrhynchoides]|uniref:agamous-like MADS-box protein AGL62 n=1 Tax=Rutidosis leptorrhynchoides TaxID=125765 RepID=UPI003A9941FA